jgi:hypothetical protein
MAPLTFHHQRSGRGRTAGAIMLIVMLAGCARPVHTQPDGQVSICGRTVHTGAMVPVVQHLTADAPAQPQPAAPVLPSPIDESSYNQLQYVRLTDSCKAGAVVTVEPPGSARLGITFPAADGRPAGIGLLVTRPVTVRAWSGGHDLGSAGLN